MDIINAYSQNKLVFELVYSLIVGLLAIFISLKSYRLYYISMHRGIKLFSFAFLCFSLSYFLQALGLFVDDILLMFVFQFIFVYLMLLSGFFLVYSLVWKKITGNETVRVTVLHAIALVLALT